MHVPGLNKFKCPELSASEGSKGRNVRAFFGRYASFFQHMRHIAAPCHETWEFSYCLHNRYISLVAS